MPSIEVVANSTKTEKPGWAYVPDTGFDPTKAPFQQPGVRKRNARALDKSEAGLSARQNAALAKRLTELDKDNSRDLSVSLPPKQRSKPKTIAAKKIVESQRFYSHFLADEEARISGENETPQTKLRTSRPKTSSGNIIASGGILIHENPTPKTLAEATNVSTDGTALDGQTLLPGEENLMYTSLPSAPSEDLISSLTTVNPLSWNDAQAKLTQLRRPNRNFCELCGYWGRIRCMQCGTRLCCLLCKRAHDEDRCQKYGG